MAKQNTHLEHLEDDILNQGSKGGFNAIAFLRELGKMLTEPQSAVNITTKWDGAPAVICGKHPSTGRFFVGTKGVFAKMPKICVSDADVDEFYSGELAKKLKMCLRLLPQLPINGVVQGDLLFTKGDVTTKVMGKQKCHTFMPNTITYAVPVDTPMGKKVSRSSLGIVFHTSYTGGPTLRDMTPGFGVNVTKMQAAPNVAVFSSDFTDATGSSVFKPADKSKYDLLVNRAEGSLKQASRFLDILQDKGEGKFMLSAMFKVYFNSFIRTGKPIVNAQAVAVGFNKFYTAALDKEISMKKTDTTKKKYETIKQNGLRFLKQNARAVYMTVASYMNLIAAKTVVIKQLGKVQDIGTYIKTDNGYRVTAPEGFVAIKSGSALKLVDRLEFSRANFTVEKNWG
mgnify:CR=1 FL=1|tara:strand:- start:8954 stop:10147 length:1194 start_codon:yes stop_codon:yes gene_type:complete